jgi:AraC-like DNA-binding protein
MYQLESRRYWSDPHLPIQLEYRDPQSAFPLHIHDFHEIALIFFGKATHFTTREAYEIQGGDIINIKPGQAHGYKNIRDLTLMNILVDPVFFEENRFGLRTLPAYHMLFDNEPEDDSDVSAFSVIHFRMKLNTFLALKNLIESISREMTDRLKGYQVTVTSYFLHFLSLLSRAYDEKQQAVSSYGADVIRLIEFVKEHYRGFLSMDQLLEISGMSESRVQRIFKHHFGCSPFQYINRLRLSAAKDDLILTSKSITEIALDLGFNDSNYFTRRFKESAGMSPREFRNRSLKESIL